MNNLKYILKYLKKSPFSIIFSFLSCLIFVPAMLLIPYCIGKGIDEFIYVLDNNLDLNSLIKIQLNYIAILSILILLVIIFQYIFEILVNTFIEKISFYLKNEILNKLNNVSLKFIDNHLHGDLINLTINDVDNVNNALISAFKQLYQGFITIIFTLSFMFYLNWLLALIIIILTPISFLLSYFISKNNNKYFKMQSEIVAKLSSLSNETFNNLEVVKSYNYENKLVSEYNLINEKLYKVGQKAQFYSSLTNPSTRLINNTIYGIVGIVGAILVVYGNKIDLNITLTVGGITTFLQYATQFAKPLNEISSCINELQIGLASLKRINNLLNEKDDINEGTNNINMIDNLTFNNVNFGYEKDKLIFKDINFEVIKGKKIAIVGPTGCGKTTIINLILRFYDPNYGKININNLNNLNIEKGNLRENFGMVLQDSWIFDGTVLENIKYGSESNLEKIIEISKKSYCYDFIKRLPKGFNTKINDNEGLSKGEKQLISIARVMLKEPDFLILDEATSNVDTRTEILIGKALDELMKNKTSIVIAHRLSTIKSADTILVINNGEIIEKGNHNELLKKKGFYYNLFNSQYK